MSEPVPPYGVAIQEAIASGDIKKMKAAAQRAQDHIAKYGDVKAELKKLRTVLDRNQTTKRAGAADVVPYGDSIRSAIKSGEVKKMKDMAKVADEWLSRAEVVRKALGDLKKEIKNLES